MLLELSEFSQFKLMRQANSASTRKAELRQRCLFNFISAKVFGFAVLLLLASIFFDLYVHEFVIDFGHDTFQRAMLLIATNVLMAAIGAWNLYGRKLDPHQDFGDRAKQIAARLSSLAYISMAGSVFLITQAPDDVFNLDFLDATLMSVYFQVIVLFSIGHLLRSLKLEDINFDVYKDDSVVTQ